MGLSYRKQSGPFRLSVSSRGPKVGCSPKSCGGCCCLVPVLVWLAAAAAVAAFIMH